MKNSHQISAQEFAERRAKLMNAIGSEAIAIIPSAEMKSRNSDAEFLFRQDSNFLYLTGFKEPESIAVFVPGREEGEYILFCREKDPKMEQWTGRMAGVEGVIDSHNVDDAYSIKEIDNILPSLMEERTKVFYSIGSSPNFDTQVISWISSLRMKVRKGIQAPSELTSVDSILNEMRLLKSPQELQLMRDAADVSVNAHKQAMQACKPEMLEYEIEAEYLYAFKKNGMEAAYTTIVGGGENACILHYIDNNAELKSNDLVLIDAGAENQGYASDITRTFPINGVFSEEQRQIYQIVLDAQYAAIMQVKIGNHWNDPHDAAVRTIVNGLLGLGLLKGDPSEIIEKKKYKPFYMHKTGHWLGLDVHDVGNYKINKKWRTLESGMVLTIEPGIYISPSKSIDKKWWNIGVRIEDDILVTHDGYEVLTGSLAKEIDDIEQLMAQQ